MGRAVRGKSILPARGTQPERELRCCRCEMNDRLNADYTRALGECKRLHNVT